MLTPLPSGAQKFSRRNAPPHPLRRRPASPRALPPSPPFLSQVPEPTAPEPRGLGALPGPSNLKFPPEGNYQTRRRKPSTAVARTRRGSGFQRRVPGGPAQPSPGPGPAPAPRGPSGSREPGRRGWNGLRKPSRLGPEPQQGWDAAGLWGWEEGQGHRDKVGARAREGRGRGGAGAPGGHGDYGGARGAPGRARGGGRGGKRGIRGVSGQKGVQGPRGVQER